MISTTKLFVSRFEVKYRLSSALAEEIRGHLSHHMLLDPFSAKGAAKCYRNNSLYLDTPSLHCYWDSEHGDKNRFKLRLRWYDDNPHGPVFLEEKRRTTDSIEKTRVIAGRKLIEDLVSGHSLSSSHFPSNSPEVRAEAMRFMDKIEQLNARPTCWVRYWREAWVSEGHDYFRVTFDREVEGHALEEDGIPEPHSPGWQHTQDSRVIMEIKFFQTMPDWMQHIVHSFELHRCSVPKYTLSIKAVKQEQIHNGGMVGHHWSTLFLKGTT